MYNNVIALKEEVKWSSEIWLKLASAGYYFS